MAERNGRAVSFALNLSKAIAEREDQGGVGSVSALPPQGLAEMRWAVAQKIKAQGERRRAAASMDDAERQGPDMELLAEIVEAAAAATFECERRLVPLFKRRPAQRRAWRGVDDGGRRRLRSVCAAGFSGA